MSTLIKLRYTATLLMLAGACVVFLVTPGIALGQGEGAISASQGVYDTCVTSSGFVPLECLNRSKLSSLYEIGDLSTYLNRMFFFAISLGAIFAVLRLAWAGFQYLASDLWSSKEHAKEVIRQTLLGLLLLLAVWLILNQINPQILSLKINAQTPATPASAGVRPNADAYNTDDNTTFTDPGCTNGRDPVSGICY